MMMNPSRDSTVPASGSHVMGGTARRTPNKSSLMLWNKAWIRPTWRWLKLFWQRWTRDGKKRSSFATSSRQVFRWLVPCRAILSGDEGIMLSAIVNGCMNIWFTCTWATILDYLCRVGGDRNEGSNNREESSNLQSALALTIAVYWR